MPDLAPIEGGDFYFVDAIDAEDGVRKLLSIVQRIAKRFAIDPIRDVQVLCPMNRGGLGARSLNIELQKTLNPPGLASSGSAGPSVPVTRSCRSKMITTRRSTTAISASCRVSIRRRPTHRPV